MFMEEIHPGDQHIYIVRSTVIHLSFNERNNCDRWRRSVTVLESYRPICLFFFLSELFISLVSHAVAIFLWQKEGSIQLVEFCMYVHIDGNIALLWPLIHHHYHPPTNSLKLS
ncbi:hypothetical protein DFP73DRAFT_397423 [Morchella snyderi]|nr:hypothetical protein DFP73DRAFT_397423 [Morchella snyderi]